MKSINPACAATRTAPVARRGAGMSHPQRRTRWWLGWVAWTVVAMAGLAAPPPAAACPWYNPICWVEEGVDYFSDLLDDIGNLVWDVLTLDPQGAYHDVVDIVENVFCKNITLLDLIGANVAESMYNNNCAAPHGIDPAVLGKLGPYFGPSLTSVVIHENCDFSNRNAITLGEHIYFGRRDLAHGVYGYQPMDASGTVDPTGFAELAHELVHVLQYRRAGFADFICQYWQECGIAAELSSGDSGVSCPFEQQAYMYQALVLEDIARDGDGIFTCDLDSHEWNAGNVASHMCAGKALLDNCPDAVNPDQADSDGDGLGDACDPGNQCTSGDTRDDDCPAHYWGSGYHYVCTQYGYWHRAGGSCQRIPPGGQEP